MKDRIIKFLEIEQTSAAKFADDIGVQRSSISHILSGRNNPSFEFIQKILTKYKKLNAEWLIMGTGNMYKTVVQGTLFDDNEISSKQEQKKEDYHAIDEQKTDPEPLNIDQKPTEHIIKPELLSTPSNKKIEKIILLYSDKSFGTYFPE
jgi:transcriptional regulator with XRE-family HTH domain